jgi:hypothetical protein
MQNTGEMFNADFDAVALVSYHFTILTKNTQLLTTDIRRLASSTERMPSLRSEEFVNSALPAETV